MPPPPPVTIATRPLKGRLTESPAEWSMSGNLPFDERAMKVGRRDSERPAEHLGPGAHVGEALALRWISREAGPVVGDAESQRGIEHIQGDFHRLRHSVAGRVGNGFPRYGEDMGCEVVGYDAIHRAAELELRLY